MNGVIVVGKPDRAHIARMESEMGLVVTEPDFLPSAGGGPDDLECGPGAVWFVESHNYVQIQKMNWLEDGPTSEGEC